MGRWMLPEEEDMLLNVGVIRVSNSQKILCYRDSAGLYFQSYINMNDSTLKGLRVDPQKVKLPPVVAADIDDFFENEDRLKLDKDEALNQLLRKNYQSFKRAEATKKQEEIFGFISGHLGLYCRAVLGDYEVETEIDCAMRKFMGYRKGMSSLIDAVKLAGHGLPVEHHQGFIKRLASELESESSGEVDSHDSN